MNTLRKDTYTDIIDFSLKTIAAFTDVVVRSSFVNRINPVVAAHRVERDCGAAQVVS